MFVSTRIPPLLPFAYSTEVPWWAYVAFFVTLLAIALFARNRDVNDAQRLLENDWSARAIGLFVIAFGSGAAYLLAYRPIVEALMRHQIILVQRGALSIPAIVVYAGLLLLVAGRDSPKLFIVRPGEAFTAIQWAIVAIGLAIALGLELGFSRFFQARGYTPHF